VDIVIGHTDFISKDIEFQRILGLFDCRWKKQRFGLLKTKEKLKQLKLKSYALDLNGYFQLPRTFCICSMLGVRDLSVIETPPANRLPCSNICHGNKIFELFVKPFEREIG